MTPQQIDAMKLALDLATMHHTDDGYAELRAKVRSASKEALAEHAMQEVQRLGQEIEQEPLEYWNAVEGWVKIDEVREHFETVGCATIYKTAGEGRVPLSFAKAQSNQEPVVFCMHWIDRWGCNHYADPKEPHPVNAKPLYTAPPQRKPLTDDLYNELLFAVGNKCPNETRHQTALRYILQAEKGDEKAAHGIKGDA